MKRKLKALSQRYRAALRKDLQQGPRASLQLTIDSPTLPAGFVGLQLQLTAGASAGRKKRRIRGHRSWGKHPIAPARFSGLLFILL